MDNERRKFFLNITRGAGLLAISGFTWSAYVSEASAHKLLLRPPGALKEKDFLASCIKCGMCVEACPYDTLKLAKPGDNKPLGTPYYEPRDIPCYMCEDIPCVPVCPSGALDIKSVSNKKGDLDITQMQMGVAVVDTQNCIAYWGIQCDACYRACPLLDQAIRLEYSKNDRTGKHAFLKPVVNNEICTGCGLCERACVTKKASITVLPREVVLGEVGTNYIKGWDKNDEHRLEGAKSYINKTNINKKSAIDNLNSGIEDLIDE